MKAPVPGMPPKGKLLTFWAESTEAEREADMGGRPPGDTDREREKAQTAEAVAAAGEVWRDRGPANSTCCSREQ